MVGSPVDQPPVITELIGMGSSCPCKRRARVEVRVSKRSTKIFDIFILLMGIKFYGFI